MPITRRRRAQPPEEPEQSPHTTAEAVEAGQPAELVQPAAAEPTLEADAGAAPFVPAEQSASPEPVSPEGAASPPASALSASVPPTYLPVVSTPPVSNGSEPQAYAPIIEGGRRTARGEFFRRPPQGPTAPPVAVTQAPVPQAPTHEITLPLGNLLHLAYNPGYTGADEARSKLLSQLTHESEMGGRARCWNCGSLAIVYDRWSTRSKTFGEVGIAYCEICGVWSVL